MILCYRTISKRRPGSGSCRVGFHENGKGLAHGDLNGDGYVDLIGTNSSGRVRVQGSNSEMVYARGPIFLWLNGGGTNQLDNIEAARSDGG